MRVYINREAATRRSGGIGKYTHHLMQVLSTFEGVENLYGFDGKSWQEYTGQVSVDNTQQNSPPKTSLLRKIARNIPGLKVMHEKILGQIFKNGAERLHKKSAQSHPKIYHDPNYILKPFKGLKVATIHDLSFIYYPQFHPPARVNFFRKKLPQTLNSADHLITDTECIRQELIAEFTIPAEKITAIHLGVDSCYKPRDEFETKQVMETFGLSHGKYLLSVATLEPRKNLGNILEGFSQLPETLRKKYPLVLVGCEGWMNNDLHTRIKELEKSGEVRVLGYVDEKDLPILYSGARGVVFIPVYEGFGLPAVEAMASGVPLLASDIPCLREVVAEAGLYVPIDDTSKIASCMSKLLSEEPLRDSLIEAGLKRASQFTWQRCAEQTLAVYKRLFS